MAPPTRRRAGSPCAPEPAFPCERKPRYRGRTMPAGDVAAAAAGAKGRATARNAAISGQIVVATTGEKRCERRRSDARPASRPADTRLGRRRNMRSAAPAPVLPASADAASPRTRLSNTGALAYEDARAVGAGRADGSDTAVRPEREHRAASPRRAASGRIPPSARVGARLTASLPAGLACWSGRCAVGSRVGQPPVG
jgi:hypothetical protein